MKISTLLLFLSIGASSCVIEDDYEWEEYEVTIVNRSDEAYENIVIGPHTISYLGPNERTGTIVMKRGSHDVSYYSKSTGSQATTIKLDGSGVAVQVYL